MSAPIKTIEQRLNEMLAECEQRIEYLREQISHLEYDARYQRERAERAERAVAERSPT